MKNKLYLQIWRWHFYAGLFIFPFLIILALSGSVYLFQPQLDRLFYSSLVVIAPSHKPLLQENILAETVKKQFPQYSIGRYYSPEHSDQSARFDLVKGEEILATFYNPYEGNFLGTRISKNYIQEIARNIHGKLLMGKTGDTIVELSACWALILILTGLYLAWPRNSDYLWGFFLPRLNKGSRLFWRDLHTAAGVYGSFFIIVLILTGLPWTGFWGDRVLHTWDHYPKQLGSGAFESVVLTKTLNDNNSKIIPWAAEKMPLPNSVTSKGETLDLKKVISIGLKEKIQAPFTIAFPLNEKGVFTISAVTGDPKNERVIHIDRYSGKVLATISAADYSAVASTVQYGIALHEGKYFGLPNQLLGLFACVMLILLSLSGIVMWWKRRPSGSLGAPVVKREELTTRQKQLSGGFILLMGVLFPLVGISLIIVWLFDTFILSDWRA